jgi:hypothetical protein
MGDFVQYSGDTTSRRVSYHTGFRDGIEQGGV